MIPNYNGLLFLKDCLDSVFNQNYSNFEVILVDNASSDNSIRFVTELYPAVRIFKAQENAGYSAAANIGIAKSQGKCIFLLNTDTILHPDCLFHLADTAERNPDYGMYAPKMVYPDKRINSAGICVSRSGAAWDRGIGETDLGQYDQEEEVFGPCGGAALYTRELLDNTHGFDEDFFLYMEDVDLACRAHIMGFRCLYTHQAVVTHHHGGTIGVGSDLAIYYGNRNIMWVPVKNFPTRFLLLSIPWIMGRTLGIIPYYAFRGKGRVVLRAKLDGILGFANMVKKRSPMPEITWVKLVHWFARIPSDREK
ncbi:MAG TPA: glycosyltransferase family 2 protein [Methanospirillum sp.]|nr:glycosyltransferase family 2 protein [Methanospirillum sp.]